MQQHQHHCIDGRRPRLMDSSNKTRHDEFYTKLERVRLSAAASSSKPCSQRSATELLDESKAYFVKSQEVLRKRQSLLDNGKSNEQKPITAMFRTAHPRRSPYQDCQYVYDHIELNSLDLALRSSTSPVANSSTEFSDCGIFESVSLLSLSDQTTLDSSLSPSTISRTVVPSSALTVIERNARIIKWLFQLNKANATPTFQTVQ